MITAICTVISSLFSWLGSSSDSQKDITEVVNNYRTVMAEYADDKQKEINHFVQNYVKERRHFSPNPLIYELNQYGKLYCGYVVSGEITSPHMKELQIIDKDTFEQAQFILDQRSRKNDDKRQIAMTTKSKALLSGIMFCSHCGGRLTANLHHEKYKRADGSIRTGEYLKYVCYHKSRRLCECDGQSTFVAGKADAAVCAAVMDIFGRIKGTPDEAVLQKKYNKEIAGNKAKQTKLNLELKKYGVQLEKQNAEIASSLTGDSVYTPEQLSAAISFIKKLIKQGYSLKRSKTRCPVKRRLWKR